MLGSGRRLALVFAACTLVATGCGIGADSSPRDMPEDEQDLGIDEAAGEAAASGANRIYLIGPGDDRLLRSVQREEDSPFELIQTLLRGPNEEETQAHFDTAIPTTTELLSTRIQAGVLTVNLSSDIDELDTPSLVLAIAQIVYTANEIENINAVQIEIDGERVAAPTSDGRATTDTLRIYDYPNVIQTSQPAFPAAPVSGS